MKQLKSLIILLLALIVISCQPGGINNSGNPSDEPSDNPQEIEGQGLSFSVKNIKTIGPYSYSTTGSTGSLSAIPRASQQSYLSYTSTDDGRFQPLVFTSSNGTKVIFENTELEDLGDGYYFVTIGSICTITQEPKIEYQPTDEKDEFGNIVYEPVEVIIDVELRYGANYAVIDTDSENVFLLMPLDGQMLFYIRDPWDGPTLVATDKNIFIVAEVIRNTNAGIVLYQISKDDLKDGQAELRARTSVDAFDMHNLITTSDDVALIADNDVNLYVLDMKAQLSPSRIIADDYKVIIDEYGNTITPYFDTYYRINSIADGSYIYNFTGCDKGFMAFSFNVNEGKMQAVNHKKFPISTDYVSSVQVIGSEKSNGGINAYLRIISYMSDELTVSLVQATCKNGNIECISLDMPSQYRASDYFQIHDGKVYWIGAVNNQDGSYICTADFSTKRISSELVPGKPVADSEFSLNPNGSMVYLQYLSDVDVATYSWNPFTDDYPTLLLTTKGDVHSIINIDTL